MKRVLIVDDSAMVRAAMRTFFDNTGQFDVCGEAVDGVDCIEKCKQLQPDVVVLDLAMPRMNGAEVAPVLHGINPRIKIVLFSIYSESIGHQLASTIGVDVVVSKREGVNRLIELITDLPGDLRN